MFKPRGERMGDRPDPSRDENDPDTEQPLDRPVEQGSDTEDAGPDPQQPDRYQPL